MRRPVVVEADDLRAALDWARSTRSYLGAEDERTIARMQTAADAADRAAVPAPGPCGCRPGHECGGTDPGPVPPSPLAPGVIL